MAGRISRRLRSRTMMQNIFQTSFSASKYSFRSPSRTTLRTKIPTDQFPQCWRMGIAAADFQLFHDLIGRVKAPDFVIAEQGMNQMGHGAVDPPGIPNRPPLGDKLIASSRQLGGFRVSRGFHWFLHFVFSVFNENSGLASIFSSAAATPTESYLIWL